VSNIWFEFKWVSANCLTEELLALKLAGCKEMKGRFHDTLKLMQGLLTTDSGYSSRSRLAQLVSRFTWELPNTLAGFVAAVSTTLLAETEVSFFHGSTFVRVCSDRSNTGKYRAATLGSFILGSAYSEPLLQHEYGHCLQSRRFGLGYLPLIALPSLFSIVFSHKRHNNRWFEQDADMRAKAYMSGRGTS
jgi:hypothetical protein